MKNLGTGLSDGDGKVEKSSWFIARRSRFYWDWFSDFWLLDMIDTTKACLHYLNFKHILKPALQSLGPCNFEIGKPENRISMVFLTLCIASDYH
jgi:hypothetical protein